MANPLDQYTEDQRETDDQGISRIVVRPTVRSDATDSGVEITGNRLTQAVAPESNDLMAGLSRLADYVKSIPVGEGQNLLGPSPEGRPRYQLWPERMVRSATTLPGDVMSGDEPMYVIDPTTGEQVLSPHMIERTQDMAGLAGGGALTAKPGGATLGSGPIRPGVKPLPVEPVPVFYSALEHAATNAAQETMSPQQWLGFLKNQPGVKAEELTWTGLPEWLGQQKGKVKKEDVQAYLDEHKVEIKDVTKKGQSRHEDDLNDGALEYAEGEFNQLPQNTRDAYGNDIDRWLETQDGQRAYDYGLEQAGGGEGSTEYSKYQLPGGENYREHLLTLPPRPMRTAEGGQAYLPTGDVNNYHSSHWDEPNVLAHVRTNDRVIDDKKSLHIEEIQSDWHQQGKKQGYQSDKPLTDTEKVELSGLKSRIKNDHSLEDQGFSPDEARRLEELSMRSGGPKSGVPDAPFKTTWPELALKRMIRQAAENGYDRISWTPGEAQAARYDLSKSIDNIKWSPEGQRLEAFKDGRSVMAHDNVSPEKLADYIGKEAADKIVNKPTKITDLGKAKLHDLSGVDLKVGGKFHRKLYDEIIPRLAEKIGKAHGVKVKQTKLPSDNIRKTVDDRFTVVGDKRTFDTLAEAQEAAGQPVHYFDLPQSLKDHAIGKGFPLYMSGVPFPLTPVDHDPFKKDK